jgi:ATP-binding cassette, subfamily C, bacterial CydC
MSSLVRLLQFLGPFRWQVTLSVLVGAAAVSASIGLLGTSAYLIASAALHPSVAALQVAIVGVRFFGISRAVLRYLERLITHDVNFRLLVQLRAWFYRALEPLAPARLLDFRSGDLLSRAVNDIDTLENFYVRAVAPPLIALLVTAGVSLFVGRYHPLLAGLLLAALLLAGAGLPLLAYLLSRSAGRASVTGRSRLSAGLVDLLQGASDLAAYSQSEQYLQRVLDAGRSLSTAQHGLGRVGALVNALSLLLSGLAVWGVLVLGVPLVGSRLDGVSLAVLVLVVLASFEAVNPLAPAAQHLETSLAAARRLFQLVDAPPAVRSPAGALPGPRSPDLRIRELSFGYLPGEPLALDGFSLDLPAGRQVALVGPSGSGKSTLFNLLLRFWDFSQGEICLDGQDIRSFMPEDVRRWLVVINQSTYLFASSLRQNLLLAQPRVSAADLQAAIEGAQLIETVAQLPQGLDTWVGERGVQLSAGERQRVALARAMLRLNDQPGGILLLDEPTANLDVENERRFFTALRTAATGRSLVLITHRLGGLEDLDEIVVLRGGQVIERGRQADLLQDGGEFARLWEIHRQSLPE